MSRLTIFQAATKVQEHVEKIKPSDLVSATFEYAIEAMTGQILKVNDRKDFEYASANCYIFKVKIKNGNVEVEQA